MTLYLKSKVNSCNKELKFILARKTFFMGGLLAFRVGNFDNTAEREQFRLLCSQLSMHYENSNEFCVLVGNYNIGCELDAMFIKKDAIIIIEFKNYGGHIVANKNGEWTANGVTIKGGSKKTVLQQARINHSIVKKELKALGLEAKQIKDIPTLIVFHQPITVDNNLSATNKSWLHITDNEHFIEKLDDITCPKTDITPLGIVNIAELLNLNSFYLKEFSNASYDKPAEPIAQIELFEDIKKYETSKSLVESNETDFLNSFGVSHKEGISSQDTTQQYKNKLQTAKELMPLRNYAEQIVCAVWKRDNFDVNVIDYKDFSLYFKEYSSFIQLENIIIVTGNHTDEESKHLQKFLKKEIVTNSSNMLFWQTGEPIGEITSGPISISSQGNVCEEEKQNPEFTLPIWIDDLIYNKLGAKYSPDHVRFEYNLDLNEKEVLVYLGTYFPRSLVEVYSLFRELLCESNYQRIVGKKKKANILDIGCGTGGDIIGLLLFIDKYLPFIDSVNILAIDGNQKALRLFEKILAAYKKESRLEIVETIGPAFIEEEGDLDLISQVVSDDFDFIISCKAICEMLAKDRIRNNAYKRTASLLAKKLSPNGILLIEDVTVKTQSLQEFIPIVLNKELNEFVRENPTFSTLAPTVCREYGNNCYKGCFMKKIVTLSHSNKQNEISKIVFRFISRKEFADKICTKYKDYHKCQIS